MPNNYDIFISYKRKSLATANNLYYRLSTRGYSAFFDLEEMRRDNFDIQLLNYIENAKDVFVLLEEGSLDACKNLDWEKDWFCREIAFALEKKKNIIPILLGDYKMPSEDFFPDRLKELSLKHSPDFSFSFFDAYLDKLIEKKFITSEAHIQNKATSVFKFYSNENCQVLKEGKLVCSLEGMSDEPYYLPVPRKGDYRFKAINAITAEQKVFREHIDSEEDKEIEIVWEERKQTGAGVTTMPTSATNPSSTRPKAVPADSTHECFDASLMDSMSDADKIAYLRKWAAQGDSVAQYNLGRMYCYGWGVDEDKDEGVKWYRKAVEQGNVDVDILCELGIRFCYGWGVDEDKDEAVKCYRKAAEQGHADAQYNLGGMYHLGWGVEKDYVEAVEWYRKAAEQGHANAQYYLGNMYDIGYGVEEDEVEAVKWYRKSAKQGNKEAKKRLKQLGK